MSQVLLYETGFFLTALALIIGYRLLTRQINTDGLLSDKSAKRKTDRRKPSKRRTAKSKPYRGGISPSRLQMLMATLLIAIYYTVEVVQTQKLPPLRQEFLLALGGSHALYLGGKVYGLLMEKFELSATRMMKNFTNK